MKKCNNCGAVVEDNSNFCLKCGSNNLSVEAPVQQNGFQQNGFQQNGFQQNVGQQNGFQAPAQQGFNQVNGGFQQPVNGQPQPSDDKNKKIIKILIAVIGVILVIALIAIGFSIGSSNNDSSSGGSNSGYVDKNDSEDNDSVDEDDEDADSDEDEEDSDEDEEETEEENTVENNVVNSVENEIVIDESSELTQEMLNDIKNTTIALNKKIHGVYDKIGAARIENQWWGSLLMQYHKHIYPGIMKRFRRKGYYNEIRDFIRKSNRGYPR